MHIYYMIRFRNLLHVEVFIDRTSDNTMTKSNALD